MYFFLINYATACPHLNKEWNLLHSRNKSGNSEAYTIIVW
jgi:hypothetical protein